MREQDNPTSTRRRDFMLRLGSAALLAGTPLCYTGAAFAQAAAQPDLAGTDETGKRLRLADYAGRACLVSFFTSGCNLCLNDLKLMREFNGDNRGKSFVMLGVSLDEQPDDYQEYAKLIALTVPAQQRFPLLWRKAPGHSDSFGAITSMPTHFVLDKSHKLVRTRLGSFRPNDWDDLWTLLG